MKTCTDEFIQLAVDCKGYSVEEAEALADEYDYDWVSWIKDLGGDEESIKSARNFLGY